jgi:KaiC/GvpD/RAD55 family RecA-like ATPase
MAASPFGKLTCEAAEKMRQQRANGHDDHDEKPALSTVWADDIAVNLDTGGTIDGLVPRTGLVVLYGESGCGKTFVAVDLACHVAAGLPWRGMEVEQGVAIYIAAEAPESLKRRVWAWKQHHGIEHLPLLVVQSTVDLLKGDTDALVELIKQVTRERGRVALVVIDTLARSMTGNENSPEDMGSYVAACARIREAGDTLTMVVHHCGKDLARGARGHSSLRAATDVELEVSKGEDGSGSVVVTKARDELDKGRFGFRLEPVELGTNAKGRTVTTCVAVEAEATAKTTNATTLNARQRTVLDCLHTAVFDHGQEAPPARDIPRGTRVVSFARWCEVALRYMPGDKPEWRKREDFGRVVEALQAKGLVRHVDGWCWPSGFQRAAPADDTSQTSHTSQCDVSRGSAMAPETSHRIAPPYRGARMRGLRGHATDSEAEGDRGGPSPPPEKPQPAKTTASCVACKKLRPLDAGGLCEKCAAPKAAVKPKPSRGPRHIDDLTFAEVEQVLTMGGRDGERSTRKIKVAPVFDLPDGAKPIEATAITPRSDGPRYEKILLQKAKVVTDWASENKLSWYYLDTRKRKPDSNSDELQSSGFVALVRGWHDFTFLRSEARIIYHDKAEEARVWSDVHRQVEAMVDAVICNFIPMALARHAGGERP